MLSNDKKTITDRNICGVMVLIVLPPYIYTSRTHIPMQHSTKYVGWKDVFGDGMLTWQLEV